MSTKKLTIELVQESFEKEGYTLLDTVYINSHTKLNYICPQGHQHSIVWDSWKQGHKCPSCAGLTKLTIEFIQCEFGKEGYILLDTVYINCRTKLNYECPNGHKHSITFGNWVSGYRCPYCAKKAKPTIKFIKDSFKKKDINY